MDYKHKITGNIAKKTNSGKNYKVSEPKHFTIPSWIVENSEEWEQILEEKEYQILSFRRVGNNEIWSNNNGKYSTDSIYCGVDEYYMLNTGECVNSGHFVVYSIKRLSDGEVFTVGDKITNKDIDWNNCFIDSFDIDRCQIVKVKERKFVSYYPLESISHVKKPVLTTEDGVDLYELENCVSVDLSNYRIDSHIISDKNDYVNFNYKYFSNRQAAKQYILNNKPVLSLKDVLKSIDVDIEEEATLTDLVRSRL